MVQNILQNLTTFNLYIPVDVETKIRHLCNKIHSVEWSGVLFYTSEGSLDNGTFQVTCKDIYVMDIGSSGYTEFDDSPAILNYQCTHPELLEEGVQEGLIHSHNKMSAFFSGTDVSTLIDKGEYKNHFLSLIVNNAGKYVGRITRKVVTDSHIEAHIITTTSSYYNSFEDRRISISNNNVEEKDVEKTNTQQQLEYFEGNITIEPSLGDHYNFTEIDSRLEEIRKEKERQYDKEMFYRNSEELVLLPEKPNTRIPNPNTALDFAVQLLTGNVFASYSSEIQVRNIISAMDAMYKRKFDNNQEVEEFFSFFIDTVSAIQPYGEEEVIKDTYQYLNSKTETHTSVCLQTLVYTLNNLIQLWY